MTNWHQICPLDRARQSFCCFQVRLIKLASCCSFAFTTQKGEGCLSFHLTLSIYSEQLYSPAWRFIPVRLVTFSVAELTVCALPLSAITQCSSSLFFWLTVPIKSVRTTAITRQIMHFLLSFFCCTSCSLWVNISAFAVAESNTWRHLQQELRSTYLREHRVRNGSSTNC